MPLCDQIARDDSMNRFDENVLRTRVCAEFREMPGLRVTLPQAARLFSIDACRCHTLLTHLVEMGELSTDGRVFARAGTGRRYQ